MVQVRQMSVIPGNTVVTMWNLLKNRLKLVAVLFCFQVFILRQFAENPIQTIWCSHSTVSSVFPCYCFPKVSKVEDKIRREQISTNSTPPLLWAFVHCANTCISLWVLIIIFLIFFTYTQTGHLSSIPDKRWRAVFIFKICFFKPLVTNIPDHSRGVE